MSKLVPAGRRTTWSAGRFVFSCAVPVGRSWPARYTQTRSPTARLTTLPDCVDDTPHRLGSELPPGTAAALHRRRTNAELPVGGVDAGDDDADTNLAGPRFGHSDQRAAAPMGHRSLSR